MYYCKRCDKNSVEFSEDEGFYVCDPCGLCYDESELITSSEVKDYE